MGTKRRTTLPALSTLLAVAAAGALLGTAAVGTAQAVPGTADPRGTLPGNWFHVSVMEGDRAAGDPKGTLLRCPARTGDSHPHADAACRELAAAEGDINRIPAEDLTCPMIYKPVRAVAHGMWDGRRVAYTRGFSNACVLHAMTGSVFKVDD
ncbi:SSI family serine proteinase inhibitor [Streptomyces sp. HmicA12]|uniref:SSI family serine proteinase inhibitor n=1 Tax=Streptomyces sp. HmicA12 TaxID=1156844 RepID=UPI003B63FBA0